MRNTPLPFPRPPRYRWVVKLSPCVLEELNRDLHRHDLALHDAGLNNFAICRSLAGLLLTEKITSYITI